MEKNFKKDIKTIYIYAMYFISALVILFSLSYKLPYVTKNESFNYLEHILINLTDSYMAYYSFPFLLGFFLIMKNVRKQNIYYVLTRYESRNKYYFNLYIENLKGIIKYLLIIVILSLLSGFGNSKLFFEYSDSYYRYVIESGDVKLYINILFAVFFIIILYFLLLAIFLNLIFLLNHTKLSVGWMSFIFVIFIILNSITGLGAFGETLSQISIFSVLLKLSNSYLVNIFKVLIGITINAILICINFYIFNRREIIMPKGNKVYQNE